MPTPTKPITKPTTRELLGRSFNQTQAMAAPNSGTVALISEDKPTVMDCSA